jgi:hypothetical protein
MKLALLCDSSLRSNKGSQHPIWINSCRTPLPISRFTKEDLSDRTRGPTARKEVFRSNSMGELVELESTFFAKPQFLDKFFFKSYSFTLNQLIKLFALENEYILNSSELIKTSLPLWPTLHRMIPQSSMDHGVRSPAWNDTSVEYEPGS